MKTMRVLMVWGSETNNTSGFTEKIEKEWQEKHGDAIKVLDIVQGDKMAERWDEVSSDNYDFLLIATSSYGEGDAPSGFGKFLYRLQEASKGGDKPLKGLQHAVLGIGSTCYETFQNCPRMCDKYLGEAGSRRCKERFEWDEMENVDSDVLEWGDAVFQVMTESIDGGADKEEVCAWSVPESQILKKVVDEDGYEVGQGPPGLLSAQTAVLAAGAVAVGAFFYLKNQNATEGEL